MIMKTRGAICAQCVRIGVVRNVGTSETKVSRVLLQFPANLKSGSYSIAPRNALVLDEEGFKRYLRKIGKSEKRCDSEVSNVKKFEEYLLRHKNRMFGAETPEDLRGFVNWAEGKREKINVLLWVLNRYYTCVSNDLMFCAVNELIGSEFTKKGNLKDFLGVNRQHAQALRKEGVFTSEQMLRAGRTKEGREKLAEKTGVPLSAVLELVKLADLSRIPGLARKRARLYYDAGLDMMDKIAEWDHREMQQMFAKFVERTGFDGTPPTPFEAAFTVKLAKYLPRIVEY